MPLQHCASPEHPAPTLKHPASPQRPENESQVPLQQSAPLEQPTPTPKQPRHEPVRLFGGTSQLPLQHSPSVEHESPAEPQLSPHVPFEQLSPQHCPSAEHGSPSPRQPPGPHVPFAMHHPLQHSLSATHLEPSLAHDEHSPYVESQTPEQH